MINANRRDLNELNKIGASQGKKKKTEKKTTLLSTLFHVVDTEEKTCLAHEFCKSQVHSLDYENICM